MPPSSCTVRKTQVDCCICDITSPFHAPNRNGLAQCTWKWRHEQITSHAQQTLPLEFCDVMTLLTTELQRHEVVTSNVLAEMHAVSHSVFFSLVNEDGSSRAQLFLSPPHLFTRNYATYHTCAKYRCRSLSIFIRFLFDFSISIIPSSTKFLIPNSYFSHYRVLQWSIPSEEDASFLWSQPLPKLPQSFLKFEKWSFQSFEDQITKDSQAMGPES